MFPDRFLIELIPINVSWIDEDDIALAKCLSMKEDIQMRFKDRADAGRQLAARLACYEKDKPVILALPRGGVTVAAEVAAALKAPMDIVLVRKIGAPIQPELALGAVVDGHDPIIVRNPYVIESTATNEEEFQALCREQLAEIERRRVVYVGRRQPLNVEGRIVIMVDDGIATGATMRAALQATRVRRPSKLVLAVPVAPADTLEALSNEVDDVICLADVGPVGAIGAFYGDFRQVTDDDVVATLRHFFPSTGERKDIDETDLRRLIGELDEAKLPENSRFGSQQGRAGRGVHLGNWQWRSAGQEGTPSTRQSGGDL